MNILDNILLTITEIVLCNNSKQNIIFEEVLS